MKFLIVLLVLAGLAYAQNSTINIVDFPMPESDLRVKLDDLKNILGNLPPVIKQQVDSMVKSLGMSLDDLEHTLDNPSEEIKQMFGPSGMNLHDIRAAINNLPEPLKQMFESEKEL